MTGRTGFYFHLNLFALLFAYLRLIYAGNFKNRLLYDRRAYFSAAVADRPDFGCAAAKILEHCGGGCCGALFCVFLVKAQDLLVRIVPYHTWIFPGRSLERRCRK